MEDSSAQFTITRSDAGDSDDVRFALAGELDAHSAPMVQQALTDGASDDSVRVVLDFSEVSFMDSSGLRIMIGESTRRRAAGGSFVLASVPRPVSRLLDVSGVSDHLEIDPG
ncbi:MAG: STAS domain-containing protein [Actinomycetota bacterium]